MFNLPVEEAAKLNGLHFRCECCGHLNLLEEFRFQKITDKELQLDCIGMENFIPLQAGFM